MFIGRISEEIVLVLVLVLVPVIVFIVRLNFGLLNVSVHQGGFTFPLLSVPSSLALYRRWNNDGSNTQRGCEEMTVSWLKQTWNGGWRRRTWVRIGHGRSRFLRMR